MILRYKVYRRLMGPFDGKGHKVIIKVMEIKEKADVIWEKV